MKNQLLKVAPLPDAEPKPEAMVPAWGAAFPGQQERVDIKRRSIVREAARSFNRAGFHGTSMGDIAKRLGVTKAALYRYVPTAQIRAAQGGAGLVSFMVHAVVEVPGGAHPTSCYPDYPVDVVHMARYLRRARNKQTQRYLDRYVLGPGCCISEGLPQSHRGGPAP